MELKTEKGVERIIRSSPGRRSVGQSVGGVWKYPKIHWRYFLGRSRHWRFIGEKLQDDNWSVDGDKDIQAEEVCLLYYYLSENRRSGVVSGNAWCSISIVENVCGYLSRVLLKTLYTVSPRLEVCIQTKRDIHVQNFGVYWTSWCAWAIIISCMSSKFLPRLPHANTVIARFVRSRKACLSGEATR